MIEMLKAALMATALALPASAIAGTSGSTSVTVEGVKLRVYTYKPSCPVVGTLFVFHGNERTAASYRDAAKPLADSECLSIYAPLFDSTRFPSSAYHMGGVRADGPATGRTVDLVDDLIAWASSRDGGLPVTLYGHSAGGQFLSRVAAYAAPADAARIIVANPSTHVLPTAAENAPYGFDMVTDDQLDATEAALLKAYLAAPVTVFLGSEDTGTEDLASGAAAMRQGVNRLDRGQKTFAMAQEVARLNALPFGWRLVVAEGIGHEGGRMMRSPEMLEAMAPGLPALPECNP